MFHRFGLVRHRTLLGAVVGVTLLVSAGVASGSGTPTLKLSGVPASVKEGSSFSVTASGYSGKFSDLEFYPLVSAACKSTSAAQASQQHSSYGVPMNHSFKTTAHIYLYRYRYGRTPGTYHFCVYLRQQSNPTGAQLHQSVTYQVTS